MSSTPKLMPPPIAGYRRVVAAVGLLLVGLMAFANACGSSGGGEVLPTNEATGMADPAPAFELPNANTARNETIALSQYQDDKSVVLVFYRAYW